MFLEMDFIFQLLRKVLHLLLFNSSIIIPIELEQNFAQIVKLKGDHIISGENCQYNVVGKVIKLCQLLKVTNARQPKIKMNDFLLNIHIPQ